MHPLEIVCNAFNRIEEEPGRKAKEAILLVLSKDSPEVVEVTKELLSMGLDWYRKFGVRTFEGSTFSNSEKPIELAWSLFHGALMSHRVGGEKISRERWVGYLCNFREDLRKWPYRALLKDLNMGVAEGTVSKVFPGLVRSFSCMLAEKFIDHSDVKFPVALEKKIDGVRCLAFIDNVLNKVTFYSRSGQELCNCDLIEKEILQAGWRGDVVIDGELFVDSFNKTMTVCSPHHKNAPNQDVKNRMKYYMFDILKLDSWKKKESSILYIPRKDSLFRAIDLEGKKYLEFVPFVTVYNQKEFTKVINQHLDEKWEGSMVKNLDGVYEWDRSKNWLKHKPIETYDFKVLSVYEGEGKHKGRLGGFVVELPNEKTCKVGGGFVDIDRENFWRGPPIGKFIEVEFKCFTPDGLLREPVFTRLRLDKV